MRLSQLSLVVISLFIAPVLALAAIPYPDSIVTSGSLLNKYKTGKISILVIPGHINSLRTGARFRGVKESDLTKQEAEMLAYYLRQDGKFSVFTFSDVEPYFADTAHIKEFRREAYANAQAMTDKGIITANQAVEHVTIPNEDNLILYGINKWVRDQNIDLVVHLHFNDYPRRYQSLPGQYSGSAVYIPERQLVNYDSSFVVAKKISERLEKYFPTSDYLKEGGGIVEDQDLIAVGAPSALYGPALLIESAYLYEPQLIDAETRPLALQELAYQTYLGIKSFFDADAAASARQTVGLPHSWHYYLRQGFRGNADVYALQLALREEGLYPPLDRNGDPRSKNDCPVNGNFGGCTHKALMAFQKKYGIEATGFAGPATIKKLNELYDK